MVWKEGMLHKNSWYETSLCYLDFILTVLGVNGQSNDCQCCTIDYANFDFWMGSWVVENSSGEKLGNNTIEKLEGGCLLQENWVSNDGKSTGTSVNFYNSTTQEWEQLWVDNTGSHLKLSGNREGSKMILSSELFLHKNGNQYINRITWTDNENGTVRQLWELLSVEEKVIFVLFDGIYRKLD